MVLEFDDAFSRGLVSAKRCQSCCKVPGFSYGFDITEDNDIILQVSLSCDCAKASRTFDNVELNKNEILAEKILMDLLEDYQNKLQTARDHAVFKIESDHGTIKIADYSITLNTVRGLRAEDLNMDPLVPLSYENYTSLTDFPEDPTEYFPDPYKLFFDCKEGNIYMYDRSAHKYVPVKEDVLPHDGAMTDAQREYIKSIESVTGISYTGFGNKRMAAIYIGSLQTLYNKKRRKPKSASII